MALALTCACGNRFEVDETFAGRLVQCPECQDSVKAPITASVPLRTSGFAITSVICALLLGLTVIGPVLAVLFGVLGLISIARHRDRVTGAGYATFGIVAGLAFAGISVIAFTKAEVFEGMRTRLLLGKIDTTGPMEVVVSGDGIAITRPTVHWGVASLEVVKKLGGDYALVLIEPGQDSYLGVQAQPQNELTVAAYRDSVLEQFRSEAMPHWPNNDDVKMRDFVLLSKRDVTMPGAAAAAFTATEAVFNVRLLQQPVTFQIRFLKETSTSRLFAIRAWCSRRRYEKMEPEFRKAMDSFRTVKDKEEHP